MKRFVIAILLLGLTACEEAQEREDFRAPVAFHAQDECHVCGMSITSFPGPKGQAIEGQRIRKFCSSAEMLGWYLQPEQQARPVRLYVHDMSLSEWDLPDDEHLIDASKAYFVRAPHLPGAMGTPMASFSALEDAQEFARRNEGQILRLEDISAEVLQQEHNGFQPSNHQE
ncbi:nitrous oxide reductase accessory protein NosL [Bowmanella dokdonensis]|uniref:Nitrous oxide reductase accessory protein NosL n=1 Tax=Bowmanella dokdonensis TaxID=751969 RepID=A0A939ILL2_9ALTE|nr:nitrous oxide reductase accessory protein NosL [Bowmanella dokdonensis]MBN7824338.1 nitrous oxide reductase accessory protein NosL [Bowmanella dokdonensis]